MRCAMARAWMSVWPPGANGTTMRTGLPDTGNAPTWKAHSSSVRNAHRMALSSSKDTRSVVYSPGVSARHPERIVCLTEETTETLYLLGEERRIVGISGYTVRPPRARREKPRVSAFLSARMDRILELKPDLVLGFSDLQADIVRDLAKAGLNVLLFNQRSVDEILSMILTLSAIVGCAGKRSRADRLAGKPSDEDARRGKPVPVAAAGLLRGMGRADDQRHPLGERAGRDRRRRGCVLGALSFAGGDRPHRRRSGGRSSRRNPEVILGSWCGKKFRPERVAARPGWSEVAGGAGTASCIEIKSADILQPGPGGAHRRRRRIHEILRDFAIP